MEFAHIVAILVGMGCLYLAYERVFIPLRDTLRGGEREGVSTLSADAYVPHDDDAPETMHRDHGLSGLSALSEAQRGALLGIMIDRSRPALISALVACDWKTGEIRAVLKGDNGVIGTEVDAARARLGITETPRYVTVRERGEERKVQL
jgi:hypothetical protein